MTDYDAMRAVGRSAVEVCEAALADGLDTFAAIRLLRRLFDLDLRQAKEALVQARGGASLSEHEERIAAALEQALRTRFVTVLLDGVNYLHGTREPVNVTEATDEAASKDGAEAALRAVIAGLEGLDQRLRAGFAAVRFGEAGAGAARWVGPAWLFSFEARTAGTFETTFAGEDPSEWDPPDVEVAP